jgi:hypothetical protein
MHTNLMIKNNTDSMKKCEVRYKARNVLWDTPVKDVDGEQGSNLYWAIQNLK